MSKSFSSFNLQMSMNAPVLHARMEEVVPMRKMDISVHVLMDILDLNVNLVATLYHYILTPQLFANYPALFPYHLAEHNTQPSCGKFGLVQEKVSCRNEQTGGEKGLRAPGGALPPNATVCGVLLRR